VIKKEIRPHPIHKRAKICNIALNKMRGITLYIVLLNVIDGKKNELYMLIIPYNTLFLCQQHTIFKNKL
jgi:hypothetical protein